MQSIGETYLISTLLILAGSVLIISSRILVIYSKNRTPQFLPKWYYKYEVMRLEYFFKRNKKITLVIGRIGEVMGISILIFSLYPILRTIGISWQLFFVIILNVVVLYVTYKVTLYK